MRRLPPLLCLAALAAGCVSADWSEPADFYRYVSGLSPSQPPLTAPRGREVTVCRAYSCRVRTPVRLGEADLAPLRPALVAAATPAEERAALAAAVAHLERVVGARIGHAGDRGRLFPAGSGDPGQLDCIDEAANTTAYLTVLASEGLVRHHEVRNPALRGFFLDGRYPHFAAVLAERATGTPYVMDSWVEDNGVALRPMPLEDWLYAWDA